MLLLPFKKNNKYFVKTVTFYYIGTYAKSKRGWTILNDATMIECINDWEQFYLDKNNPEKHAKVKPYAKEIYLNNSAIIDVTPWS